MSGSPGPEIGPYRVIRVLGTGGFGTVLLADDTRLRRKVALKTFPEDRLDQPRAHARLLREARAAAALNHPNIAGVHDVLDIDGRVVVVFEYAEGETLAARIARGPLPLEEALDLGIQLADGLAAAHARSIVHRDLKPANVVVTGDNAAKILDFGIARTIAAEPGASSSFGAATATGMLLGTPGYAAPEQWLGQDTDERADIYALGVVIFEMITGRRPFDTGDALTIGAAVLQKDPPRAKRFARDVPPVLDDLLMAMLARDPARRPQQARDIAQTLRQLRHGTGGAAVLPPGVARQRRWRWPAVTAAVVVVAAMGIGRLWYAATPIVHAAPPVVAVLPFANASGNPANDYLGLGMAESLTTSLASLPAVTVLSRASVAEAQQRHREIAALARELDAAYVVDGSLQQAGARLKLTLSLIRTSDGSIAWSEDAEGRFEDIFELQSRLATALIEALRVQVSPAERARLAAQPTASPEALDAYYRGRALVEQRNVEGNLDAAIAAFDEAIARDRRFALAHAARGEALWLRYVDTNDPRWADEALQAGTTAMRLEPDRPEVRYALAVTLLNSGQLKEAEEELQATLARQPTYEDARRLLGRVLARQGRMDEAVAEFRKAIAARPNFWNNHSTLGVAFFDAARYDEAVVAFQRAIELAPDNHIPYQQLGTTYQAMGDSERALANYERANERRPSPQAYSNIGALRHARGEFALAAEAYRQAIRLRPNSATAHRNLGDAYQRLGRQEEARGAYREAVRLAEAELAVNPRDARGLANLAIYHAKLGETVVAHARRREAEALGGADVTVRFRVAVVHALTGRDAEALTALRAAVDGGYSRSLVAEADEFAPLRSRPEFQALVAPSPPKE